MKKYIIICLGLLVMAACGSKKAAEAENDEEATADTTLVTLSPEQVKNAGIVVDTAQTNTVNHILNLQGTIDVPPQNIVSISFPLGGYLKSTALLPGVHVKKGEVLGVLEDIQFIQMQQDYLQTREKLIYQEAEYTRQLELNASKASSDKVLQQARAEVESGRIYLQALGQKLELIGINPRKLKVGNISRSVNIYSPIDGFVSHVNVNIGKYAAPTDVIFELVNPTDIHLALNVFEKDVAHLTIGQKVIAYTNDKPDHKYKAEIILISKNVDEDRMAVVHCHFHTYDAALLPGMFMNAEVQVKNAKALTLPEDAVVRWENQYYIFTERKPGEYAITPITPGITENDKTQVSAPGLNKATPVVTKGAYNLLMKMKNSSEEDE